MSIDSKCTSCNCKKEKQSQIDYKINYNIDIFHTSPTEIKHICPECKTIHSQSDLILFDDGYDYSYACMNCGDIMESNWNYYW